MNNNEWTITNNSNKSTIFVNKHATNQKKLVNGDVIFIMGLKIIILNNTLFINNPENLVTCQAMYFKYIKNEVIQLSLTNDDEYLKGLILQMITFHSYEELKIVMITTENNLKDWEFLKVCPHLWSDERDIRFLATTQDEISEVSLYLEKIFEKRNEKTDENKDRDYKDFLPYYVIIVDDFSLVRNTSIIESVLNQETNRGFSLIIRSRSLASLPNKCMSFIELKENEAILYENELITNEGKKFVAEINENLSLYTCSSLLANITIEYKNGIFQLPKVLGFLEMYEAGMVEQLNVINRWKENNPITSLQAPVGIGTNGEIFKLDLHEKFHGPHGLIAGMTGSGKTGWSC